MVLLILLHYTLIIRPNTLMWVPYSNRPVYKSVGPFLCCHITFHCLLSNLCSFNPIFTNLYENVCRQKIEAKFDNFCYAIMSNKTKYLSRVFFISVTIYAQRYVYVQFAETWLTVHAWGMCLPMMSSADFFHLQANFDISNSDISNSCEILFNPNMIYQSKMHSRMESG